MFSYRARSASPFGYRAGSEVSASTYDRSSRATSEVVARGARARSTSPVLNQYDVLRPWARSIYYLKTDPISLNYSPSQYSESYLNHYYGNKPSYYHTPRYSSIYDAYNPYLSPYYTHYYNRYLPVPDRGLSRYPYLSYINPYYSSYKPLSLRYPYTTFYSRVYA